MSNIDWYENRRNLIPGMQFKTKSNNIVMLDRPVPGDSTKWYVADLVCENWSYDDSTIEPGELDSIVTVDS